MMKRFIRITIIFALALLLAGCREVPAAPAETTLPADTTLPAQTTLPEETTVPVQTTVPVETTLPPETAVPTEPVPTTAPTEPVATESSSLPYLQFIQRADQSIFDGPGYDYALVGTVQQRGTYTIVEEAWDSEGNLWGKLKSGAGWVDLIQIRSEEYTESLISANYADEYLLLHGAYHYCPHDQSEYAISIAFHAYGNLRDVALFAYDFSDAGLVPGADFFTLAEWTPDMPLVAELSFPGDMTTYGIRFIDENGVTHIYSIYISLRNGALMLTKE